MTQENNSEWQYRFLKTGTEYGFGDLSAMVNVVGEILKEERNAVLSEVIDLIPNTYHEIACNKLIAKIESLKHE